MFGVFELDTGREEPSPLISGTFPWHRARDVVAWARGAKGGVDFFGMLSPLRPAITNIYADMTN